MKSDFKNIVSLILVLVAAFAVSCRQKEAEDVDYVYINPAYFKSVVYHIDSCMTAIANEPLDPKVALSEEDMNAVGHATDSAALAWTHFRDLCYDGQFKDAYNFYSADDNSGNFIIYLKHSTYRYIFYDQVIGPMIYEFEPKETADDVYLGLLSLEYSLESLTMHYAVGDTEYIPETFPTIAVDYGQMLAAKGKIDEAFELVDDYAYAMNGLSGNKAYANLSVAVFAASLYRSYGAIDNAIAVLEEYKEFTQNNLDPKVDPADYEHYFAVVDNAIKTFREQQ